MPSTSSTAIKSMSVSSTLDIDIPPVNQKTRPVNTTFNNHLESMAALLLQYRADHFLCDTLVMVDDGELQAHSVILSAASPVFKAAFSTPNAKCIKLPHVQMEVMKLALDAIYTGRIACEDSNKSYVTDLLVSFEVDVNNLEGNERTTVNEIVKRDNDEYLPADDDGLMISFNSIDELNSEMDNIAEPKIHQMVSQSGREIASKAVTKRSKSKIQKLKISSQSEASNVKDSIDCEQDSDLEETKRAMKNAKNCRSISFDKKVCKCGETKNFTISYQCQSVTPDQKKRLHEQYKSLCYRRKSLLLASLVDITKLEQPGTGNLPQRRKWTLKYWLPCEESDKRLRVCRATFFSVFWIQMTTMYEMVRRILGGTELKERRGKKALRASLSDVSSRNLDKNCDAGVTIAEEQNKNKAPNNVGVFISPTTPSSDRQNKDNFIDGSAKFTEMLSADCPCRQCKGTFHCDYCGHNTWTRKRLVGHIRQGCKKAPNCGQFDDMGNIQDPGISGVSNASIFAATKEFGCLCCSSVFATSKERKGHTELQHGQQDEKREQICDICQKVFFSRRLLREHRTDFHTGTAPSYLCPVCGKTLKNRLSFMRHVALHRKAKQAKKSGLTKPKLEFNCGLCPEVFAQQLLRAKHKEKVHGVVQQRLWFFCDRCGKRLGSELTLRKHTKKHCHDRIESEVFFCNMCGKCLASKRSLAIHQKKCCVKTEDQILID